MRLGGGEMSRDETNRIAVIVFVTVDGDGDHLDRGFMAEMAIKRALSDGETIKPYPLELERVPYVRNGEQHIHEQVTVHRVMELGIAGGNGYTWIKPTSKAYPREEELEDE